MTEFLDAIKKLDIGQVQKPSMSNEERLWFVATVLILSEKAGLVTFTSSRPRSGRRSEAIPLPKGLISLLESCEKQGLIKVNRKRIREIT